MVASTEDRPRVVAGLRLLHVVGRGGEGEVWEARDARGRARALKLIRPDALVDPGQVELRGRHLVRIDHPALVTVHRCGVLVGGALDGWGFVEMDLVEGRSLHDAPADPSLLDRLAPLAEALDLLHAGAWSDGLPLVHRDVKPSNIIATSTGSPVLVDPSTLRGVDAAVLTRIGTPLFAAPEVVTGRLGPPADVYSFAATVVALVTGARGEALADLLEGPWHLDLPDGVRRALSPLPADRPASCELVLSGAVRDAQAIADLDLGWHPVVLGRTGELRADDLDVARAEGDHDVEEGGDEDDLEEDWDPAGDEDDGWDDGDLIRVYQEPPPDRTLVDLEPWGGSAGAAGAAPWASVPAPAPAGAPPEPVPSGDRSWDPRAGDVPPWQEGPPPWQPPALWPWLAALAVTVAVALTALASTALGLPRWQLLVAAAAVHLGAHVVAGRRVLAAIVVPPAAWGLLLGDRAAPPGRARTWTAVAATGALLVAEAGLLRLLWPDGVAVVSPGLAETSAGIAAGTVVVATLAALAAPLAARAAGPGARLVLAPAWLLGAAAFLVAAVVAVVPALVFLRPAAPFRLGARTLASSAEHVRVGPPRADRA